MLLNTIFVVFFCNAVFASLPNPNPSNCVTKTPFYTTPFESYLDSPTAAPYCNFFKEIFLFRKIQLIFCS